MKTCFWCDLQKKVLIVFFCKGWTPLFEFKERCLPFLPVFLGILSRFSEVLPILSGILPTFSTNQNFWGCTCAPWYIHFTQVRRTAQSSLSQFSKLIWELNSLLTITKMLVHLHKENNGTVNGTLNSTSTLYASAVRRKWVETWARRTKTTSGNQHECFWRYE